MHFFYMKQIYALHLFLKLNKQGTTITTEYNYIKISAKDFSKPVNSSI